MYFFPFRAVRTASRWLWLMTVRTQAIDLRTALLYISMRLAAEFVQKANVERTDVAHVSNTHTHKQQQQRNAHLGKLVGSSASHLSNAQRTELSLKLFELHTEYQIERFVLVSRMHEE